MWKVYDNDAEDNDDDADGQIVIRKANIKYFKISSTSETINR